MEVPSPEEQTSSNAGSTVTNEQPQPSAQSSQSENNGSFFLRHKRIVSLAGAALLALLILGLLAAQLAGNTKQDTVRPTASPTATASISLSVSPTPSNSGQPSAQPTGGTTLTYRNQEQRISFSYPSNLEATSQNSSNTLLAVGVYNPSGAGVGASALLEVFVYPSALEYARAKQISDPSPQITVSEVLAKLTEAKILSRWTRSINAGQLTYTAETGKNVGSGIAYTVYERDGGQVVEVIDSARNTISSGIAASLNIYAQ